MTRIQKIAISGMGIGFIGAMVFMLIDMSFHIDMHPVVGSFLVGMLVSMLGFLMACIWE